MLGYVIQDLARVLPGRINGLFPGQVEISYLMKMCVSVIKTVYLFHHQHFLVNAKYAWNYDERTSPSTLRCEVYS